MALSGPIYNEFKGLIRNLCRVKGESYELSITSISTLQGDKGRTFTRGERKSGLDRLVQEGNLVKKQVWNQDL